MTRKFSIDQLRRYERFWGEGESRTITCSMQDNEQEVADENLHAEEEAHGYGCREAAEIVDPIGDTRRIAASSARTSGTRPMHDFVAARQGVTFDETCTASSSLGRCRNVNKFQPI